MKIVLWCGVGAGLATLLVGGALLAYQRFFVGVIPRTRSPQFSMWSLKYDPGSEMREDSKNAS